MTKTIVIKIKGPRVQGVGFRFESHLQMVDLGLTGKAENARDGGVEITATGEEPALEKLVAWAKLGPQGARISGVDVGEVKDPNAAAMPSQPPKDREKIDD